MKVVDLVLRKKEQSKKKNDESEQITEFEKQGMILKNHGLAVSINNYKQLPDLLPVTICYFVIYLIALILFPLNPILTFVINTLLTIGFYLEINGKLMLSYFLTLGKKQSLLAKLPSKVSGSKMLFILPQYYVGLSKTYLQNRGYKFIKILFLLFLVATLIFFIGFVHSMQIKEPAMFYWYFIILITIPVIVYGSLVFWKSFFGPQPVAKKNQYTEGLILDTIKKLTEEGELNSCDIYFLFTQDRSGDYSAVVDLIDNHFPEIKGAKIVGLDFFNGGSISINYSEGINKNFKTCKTLSMAIIALEGKLQLPRINSIRKLSIFSPLTLFLSREFEGINIISEGKALGEHYDYDDLFVELIRSLDGHC